MASLSTLCSFGVAMTLLCSGVLAGAPDESKARAPLEVVEDYDVPPKAVHVTRPVYPPTARAPVIFRRDSPKDGKVK